MSRKILIIEDDLVLGEALVQKIKTDGFDTALVSDGVLGLEKIKEWKPDMVLLDIVLPHMNGYEIMEAKQKDPSVKDIPVIIISNSGQPVEIKRTLSLGAKDYFVKADINVDDVLVKVKQYLDGGAVPKKGEAGSLDGKKVLVVEDDVFLSDLVSRKLSNQGSVVFKASSGEDALSVVEKEMPDLVLLDILLPGMSGYDVLEKIKKESKTKNIPVIMFSNFGQDADIGKSEKLGADRFILKSSSSLEEIINVVREVITSNSRKEKK